MSAAEVMQPFYRASEWPGGEPSLSLTIRLTLWDIQHMAYTGNRLWQANSAVGEYRGGNCPLAQSIPDHQVNPVGDPTLGAGRGRRASGGARSGASACALSLS